MNKFKKYALIVAVMLLTNIILPSVGVNAISKVYNEVDNLNQLENNEILDSGNNQENLNDLSQDENNNFINNSKEESDIDTVNNIGNDILDKSDNEEIVTYDVSEELVSNLENPITPHKLTSDFYLKGWAVSINEGISVEVYLDGSKVGNANYGLTRNDIGGKYTDYPNSNKSGFDYIFKNVSNGTHEVKVVIKDSKGNVKEHSANIEVNNTRTSIMGTGSLTKEQMVKLLRSNNPSKSYKYISDFVDITIKEAKIEGINHDILFSQMMHETGYLKFGGDVKEEQNNFAGLGATGGGEPGLSFPSIEIGIRAVTQHLKAYASTEPLKQECVDPRFGYVTRGTAIYVEHLGIKENPLGKGWAAAKSYGYSVLALRDKAASLSSERDFSVLNDVEISGKAATGYELTVTGYGDPTSDTLYKIWVVDRSSNEWILLSDYSTNNTVKYTPLKAGVYDFVVHVKHKNSKSANEDDYISKRVNVEVGQSTINSFNIDGDSIVGSKLTLKATATPENYSLYKFYVCDRSTNTWTVLSDYSTKNTIDFIPTKAGKYSFVVYTKHKDSSKEVEDDYRSIDVNVILPISKVKSLEVIGEKLVNSPMTMKAEGTPADGTLYKLWVCDRSTNTWTVLSDYSTKKAGRYTFLVYTKHKNSTNKDEDDYKSIDIEVTSKTSKVKSFKVSGDGLVGSKLTMQAEGTPAEGTLYKLWVCDRSTNTWTVLSDYSTKNTAEFTPEKAGTYTFLVYTKHKNSANEDEDDYRSIDVKVVPQSQQTSIVKSLEVTGEKLVNSPLTMKAEGTPADGTLYKLWVCDRSTNTWTVLSDYSTKNTIDFTPKKAGRYTFVVYTKHKNSPNKEEDDYKSIDIEVTSKMSKVKSLEVTGDTLVGSTLTMKAEGTPSEGTLYKLWVCDRTTNTWTVLSDYSTKNTIDFKPTKAGRYTFTVHVKHKNSDSKDEDDYKSIDVNVTLATSKVKSLEVTGNKYINQTLTMKAEGTPADGTLYKLWVCDRSTNIWTVLSDYSTKNTIDFTPVKAGRYTFTVHVKHKNSVNKNEDDYKSIDIDVALPVSKATSLSVTGDLKINTQFDIIAQGTPANDTLYKIWIADRNTNEWILLSDYSSNNKASFTPKAYGKYSVVVHMKNKFSLSADEDDYISKDIYIKEGKLIVIDPGHNYGGDYGSVAIHNGIKYEETVLNMQVALKLKSELEKRGYNVVLTREESDRDTAELKESLKKRVDFANNLNADLFVSIHHNSYGSTVKGMEVYYSTATPLTKGVILDNGVEMVAEDYRNIFGMRSSYKITESKKLATSVVNAISSKLGYINRGAKDNDFYVVKNTTMPSILIENGFISNASEAKKVADPANQLKTAQIIADCIADQF